MSSCKRAIPFAPPPTVLEADQGRAAGAAPRTLAPARADERAPRLPARSRALHPGIPSPGIDTLEENFLLSGAIYCARDAAHVAEMPAVA